MEMQIREIPNRVELDPSEEIWREIQEVWDNPAALRFTLQGIRTDNRINLLNEEQRKSIILHVTEQFEEQIKNDEEGFHNAREDAREIDQIFSPWSRKQKEPDFVDTYALMMKTLIETYPSAADQLFPLLYENAQLINRKVFLRSLADIIGAPNTSYYVKDSAIG